MLILPGIASDATRVAERSTRSSKCEPRFAFRCASLVVVGGVSRAGALSPYCQRARALLGVSPHVMRRYSIHIIGSRGRFFSAGEPIPDDVSIPGCAEKHRIVDEQRDESDPS